MTDIIRGGMTSYVRHDGYIMNWERSDEKGDGHQVTMLNDQRETISFRWRSSSEPVAGQRISVLMVDKGVSVHPDRPLLILNHDTSETIREQNAPSPLGTRPIMIWLSIWVLSALAVSALIIAHTEGITMMALTLLATAIVVWRLAIATSDLRYDERAQKRIQDEEKVCLETMSSAWRLASAEVFNMKRPEPE